MQAKMKSRRWITFPPEHRPKNLYTFAQEVHESEHFKDDREFELRLLSRAFAAAMLNLIAPGPIAFK
jgi:hypothetical protein